MSIRCTNCGTDNSEDDFWCKNCNKNLVKNFPSQMIETEAPESTYISNTELQNSPLDFYKTRRYGIKFLIFVVVGIILITVIAAYVSLNVDFNFGGINCKINEDFWFEEKYLNTSDGWTFTMNKVKDYTLNGIVLGLKLYNKNEFPYRPINIFSPIDLVIGVDDVKLNPEKYPYTISYFYRGYLVKFQSKNAAESEYMKTHMGNNHIIPHNETVLSKLQNISINDNVIIEGSLVSLYGTRGDQNYQWNTDTKIGNYDCEIILVDRIILEN